jgi:hypothetical protein
MAHLIDLPAAAAIGEPEIRRQTNATVGKVSGLSLGMGSGFLLAAFVTEKSGMTPPL